MERLCGDGGVGDAIPQRQLLGDGADEVAAGDVAGEGPPHRGDGFDPDDPNTARHEQLGELPGPGAELDAHASRPEAQPFDEEPDGRIREAGPPELVVGDRQLETDGRGRMDARLIRRHRPRP